MEEKRIKANIYHKSKIYAIRNCKNEEIYIGSTTQTLAKRFYQHRKDRFKNGLLYNLMREIGIEHFYIELIENIKCETKEELNKYEG